MTSHALALQQTEIACSASSYMRRWLQYPEMPRQHPSVILACPCSPAIILHRKIGDNVK